MITGKRITRHRVGPIVNGISALRPIRYSVHLKVGLLNSPTHSKVRFRTMGNDVFRKVQRRTGGVTNTRHELRRNF